MSLQRVLHDLGDLGERELELVVELDEVALLGREPAGVEVVPLFRRERPPARVDLDVVRLLARDHLLVGRHVERAGWNS